MTNKSLLEQLEALWWKGEHENSLEARTHNRVLLTCIEITKQAIKELERKSYKPTRAVRWSDIEEILGKAGNSYGKSCTSSSVRTNGKVSSPEKDSNPCVCSRYVWVIDYKWIERILSKFENGEGV